MRSRDVFVRAAGPEDQRAAVARGAGRVPSPSRVAGGAAAEALGTLWERTLEDHHALAETPAVGLLAWCDHTEPRTRYVGTLGGRPVYARVSLGPCDYLGALTRRWGGLSVAIEAKARTGELAEDEIPAHQRERLDLVAREGGLALLCVRLVDAGGRTMVDAAIPWATVPWRSLRVRRVLRPGDCALWRMVPGRIYLDPIVRREGPWVAAY